MSPPRRDYDPLPRSRGYGVYSIGSMADATLHFCQSAASASEAST